MLSGTFRCLQVVNILEDYNHVQETPALTMAINISAWIGSTGLLVAVFWNARFHERLISALNGEPYEVTCSINS